MSEGVDTSPKPPGFGSSFRNVSNLRGGLLVTLLSLGLFVASLYIKSIAVEAVVLTMSGALVAIGLAIMAGLVPIRAPQDFYGGLALIMLSTLALLASAELPGQRGFAFGPGTAPRLFAVVLAGLGAAVAVVGLVGDGPRIEKYHIRGPVLVIGAILGFAAMIRPFGLIPATFLTFMISIFGSREMRLLESLIAAMAMTAFCVLLFVYLLNLPFQLWPRF
jgi:putative tricarboxylic transport membrane protein